jgi:proton glutamate symport protein
MDMCRTSVNLLGNCLATAVVGRWEGYNYQSDPALRTESLDAVDILIEPEG